MKHFEETTHLSDILEKSEHGPVIIFKYSSTCGSSTRLNSSLEQAVENKSVTAPIYKVTVQDQHVLSKKIAEWFEIKHESPQIIIINKGKVTYSAYHGNINISEFRY